MDEQQWLEVAKALELHNEAVRVLNAGLADVVELLKATPLVTEIEQIKRRLDASEQRINEIIGERQDLIAHTLADLTDRLNALEMAKNKQATIIEQLAMRVHALLRPDHMHD